MLIIGVLLAIIGVGTIWVLKQHHRQVGKHRKDFQALHAAEAGVKFFQNRLNNIPLCHPWFTYLDSMAVLTMLKDTTVLLPTPYGEVRGFRIRNVKIIPNVLPVGIRFESVGGRMLPDGTLDTSNGRPIICNLRMRTLADFVLFNETGNTRIGLSAVVKGKLFAGGDLLVSAGNVDFQQRVYVTGNLILNGTNNLFRRGYEKVTTAPFNLNHVHIAATEPRAPCGGSLPKTYEDLAKGAVANEGKGFFYSGTEKSLLLILDSIRLLGGNVRFQVYAFDETRPRHRGPLLATSFLPDSLFNGVVYVDGDAYVEGTLSNHSLTIASPDDILVTGNIRCVGSKAGGDSRVTLALLAQNKLAFWKGTPTRLFVEAVLLAEDDKLVNLGINYDGTVLQSWLALGSAATHPGVDANGNPASSSVGMNWVLTLHGGIISRKGGGTEVFNWNLPGGTRNYEYDPDNEFSPPPKMGLLHTGGPGASLWEVSGWEEK